MALLADFVHLRVHTAYSLSSGAITVKDLALRCKGERMPAVAITDSGNMFGALEFATACAAAGVQPIIGCEVALAAREEGCRGTGALARPNAEPDRLVLLVQNETGYRNLLALVSRSFLDGDGAAAPAVSLAEIAAASDGLICLAGGAKGPVGRLLADGQDEAAEAVLARLKT
ncbi:MAG: PHP domain-containing protein, partial [Stellaceae bacterium]